MMSAATARKPRTKPRDERRGELMDAAQALFLQKGVVRRKGHFLSAFLVEG
jgi:hypothetical protein